MPIDRKRYPKDWKQTSRRIRFERANGKCEVCGALHGEPHPKTGNVVCLQTAHLNRDPEHTTDEWLMAMCAKCHFAYDRYDNYRKRYFGKQQMLIPLNEDNSPPSGSELYRLIYLKFDAEKHGAK